jgi:hypothetical protein
VEALDLRQVLGRQGGDDEEALESVRSKIKQASKQASAGRDPLWTERVLLLLIFEVVPMDGGFLREV